MGSSMQAMPNVATLVPDFSYVAQGIALKNRQELIGINPDGMKPDFLAGSSAIKQHDRDTLMKICAWQHFTKL